MNRVFAYGSLISGRSREQSGVVAHSAEPMRLKGYRRGWNTRETTPWGCVTALGVVVDNDAEVTGVELKIDDEALLKIDARETGYARLKVTEDRALSSAGGDSGLYIYVVTDPQPASRDCPIIQTYIDVVIDGCLDYGERFARAFIETTAGWDCPCVNDRKQPRYPRYTGRERTDLVDDLLRGVRGNDSA